MESNGHQSSNKWKALCLIALPLCLLFIQGLAPEKVLFSNDGPLGVISADAGALPDTFQGYWHDLHWVGMENPSALPDFSMLLGWLIGDPVVFSKVYAPAALLFLGWSAWLMARTMRWHPWVCLMVGLAAALNSNAFSNACWGLPSRATTMGSVFLALAAIHASKPRSMLLRLVLAGFAIGHGVMEGFDVGALYSVGFGCYLVFFFWTDKTQASRGIVSGLGGLALVALAAAWMASQGLLTLVGTQLSGAPSSDTPSPAQAEADWHFATQWSLPVMESVRLVIPGAFGYRMTDLDGKMTESSYWGGVGRDPRWRPGMAATGLMRHSGSGEYAGLLVVLIGLWAFYQTFRHAGSEEAASRHKFIRFWAGVVVVSMVLAFGRHTPIYQWIYSLPFFHTMRNPIKFMHLAHLGWILLFGYGLQAIWLRARERPPSAGGTLKEHLRLWWTTAQNHDRLWIKGYAGLTMVALLGWLIYASSGSEMNRFLQGVGIPAAISAEIHAFSAAEVGIFLLGWCLVGGLWLAILSGYLHGGRANQWMLLMALFLTLDLARANRPWIQYYDYAYKYATHPVLDILRENPEQGRVTSALNPFAVSSLVTQQGALLPQLYNDWLQHAFPFYNIQSLDIIQWPRPPQMDLNFGRAFAPTGNENLDRYSRLWALTSTRFILGMSGYLETLNQSFDPGKGRFRIRSHFSLVPKPGQSVDMGLKMDDLTTTLSTNGPFAVFEFDGALPRASLYDDWRWDDSEEVTLNTLANPDFDVASTVLVEAPQTASRPAPSRLATEKKINRFSYSPRKIDIETSADAQTLLLLNDRYHPDWHVYVDDKPSDLLRCNYLMRGALVPAGQHRVSFRFEPSTKGLQAALLAWLVGLAILVWAWFERSPSPGRTHRTPIDPA